MERAKPWYVGKTTAQAGYYGEIFTDHKLRHYENIMRPSDDEYRRGTPFIIFFPLVTETWRFSNNRSSSAKYVDWLETTLIDMAFSRNPTIANKSKTRFHNEVYVHGVIGNQFQERPSSDASFAKRLFVSG